MLKPVLATVWLTALTIAATAACGERGGPGCRFPNGKCAGWAQAAYCRAYPDAAQAPAPGLATGQLINENLKRRLVAMPAAPAGSVILQLDPIESAGIHRWIAKQPNPKASRQEAAHRPIAERLGAK